MICLQCDNEKFEPGVRGVPQDYRGREFTVNTEVMICTNCGWFTCNNEQADKLCHKTCEADRQYYERVYDTLVQIGGAEPCWMSSFMMAHTGKDIPKCDEWRFQGSLGFGGKYRSKTNKVDCYPEDETPQRLDVIKRLNKALEEL